MELVEKLHKTFPGVYKYIQHEENGSHSTPHRGLYIRGPGCSWVVSSTHEEGTHVLGRQNVNTAHMHHCIRPTEEEVEELLKIKYATDAHFFETLRPWVKTNKVLTDGHNIYSRAGNICIDQSDSNISLGDQIASRTMLLMNDIDNIDSVSTLRGFAKEFGKERNKEVLVDGVFNLWRIYFGKNEAIKWLKGEYLL